MRSRSNSGVKLDNYARIIQKSILRFQDPITGLFSSSNHDGKKHVQHAWVRDNLYSIQAVWGLALAYRKHADLDEDKAKAYELEQSVVKCMRSLLQCMIRQANKVEKFKDTQSPTDSLHAKYDARTCGTVVSDHEWGHLQLDATGFFVLMIAQMTTSGLSIIYTLDEVAFIQNLVFYIGFAYRTPDYGIWERGDKTNRGVAELNASSVGMCKAALEAIDELNLFGPSGGPQSVIHVTPDGKALCNAILESMLPRESNSKEVDAGLLSIIGYPAFAVNDQNLVDITKQTIVDKLQGRYGCCRFLRDGYKTAPEDPNRLHYELAELQVFENIECEWPVFWTYLILDGIFNDNRQQVEEYNEALGDILVMHEEVRCVPELYTVPADKVELEKSEPHSQDRIPIGKLPHLWGQSLYMLSQLMWDGFLAPGEIDPLNRRFSTKPKPDVVVQVAILAEEAEFQEMLMSELGIAVETRADIRPIQVQSAKVLSNFYSKLGQSAKLHLSGRPKDLIGILGTSKVYLFRNMKFMFTPNFLDQHNFYMTLDIDMLIDVMTTELQYLTSHWTMPGRPILLFPLHRGMLNETEDGLKRSLLSTFRKMQSGYLQGVRVNLGKLTSFMNTSCLTRLNFLESKAECDSFIDSFLDSDQPRLFRLGSIVEPPKISLSPQDHHEQIKEAKARGKHRKKRASNDLTNMALFNRSIRKQTSRKVIMERYCDLDDEDDETADLTAENLVDRLRETTALREQADILQYLYFRKGGDWDTAIDGNQGVLVRDLAEELYDKAGRQGNWMVIRQMTGLLEKRVNGLSHAITDLLVRQKQVTVGLPQRVSPQESKETTISKPIPSGELYDIIMGAYEDDVEIAVLTQEIIMYLSMIMKATPSIFNDLFRLRVGLIIQVMASELARHLQCSGEAASTHLMSLSPYEMKQLIHFILSGKEFGISKSVRMTKESSNDISHEISLHTEKSSKADKSRFDVLKRRLKQRLSDLLLEHKETSHQEASTGRSSRDLSVEPADQNLLGRTLSAKTQMPFTYAQFTGQKRGQWVRRRRIDGALNRVPQNFYSRIWRLLEKCLGIVICNQYVPSYVTKEMTPEEIKFALLVENVLNSITQPEYRQLVVEALIVLTLLADTQSIRFLSDNVNVDSVVLRASDLFYEDELREGATTDLLSKDATTKVCTEFYDCAPSGPFGTMTYLSRAVAELFTQYFPDSVNECSTS